MDIRVEYTNMKNRRIPTMEQIKIPDGYHSALNLHDTQIAIKTVKDFFQQTLSQKLNRCVFPLLYSSTRHPV